MLGPVFVIVNPAAGRGRAGRVWPEVAGRLRAAGVNYEYEISQGPLTATSFTRQALRAEAEVVVAVGGDGTVNEVANGFFLGDRPLRPSASLLVVPAGSSSDVARGLGIPSGPAAVDLLVHGRIIEVDVGRAAYGEDGRPAVRYFLNNADVGIGARIAAGGASLKGAGGGLAFFLSSLAALRDPQPWAGTLQVDGGPPEEVRAVSAVVALGPYTGGGMEIAPTAKWDDGLLNVVVIGAMAPMDLLLNFPRVYLGTHLSHPKVRHQTAQEVRVDPLGEPPIELDGEVVGAGPAEFRILPKALRLYVPRP